MKLNIVRSIRRMTAHDCVPLSSITEDEQAQIAAWWPWPIDRTPRRGPVEIWSQDRILAAGRWWADAVARRWAEKGSPRRCVPGAGKLYHRWRSGYPLLPSISTLEKLGMSPRDMWLAAGIPISRIVADHMPWTDEEREIADLAGASGIAGAARELGRTPYAVKSLVSRMYGGSTQIDLISSGEAARMLGISREMVERYAAAGLLAHYRTVGSHRSATKLRFDPADVEAFARLRDEMRARFGRRWAAAAAGGKAMLTVRAAHEMRADPRPRAGYYPANAVRRSRRDPQQPDSLDHIFPDRQSYAS